MIWTKPSYERKLSTKDDDFKELKFDFIYLDPPYNADYHDLVIKQIFSCNFIKKNSVVICEHSPSLKINKSNKWKAIDIRDYGQSRLTFLIYV